MTARTGGRDERPANIVVIHDEGFEEAALRIVQAAGIQPAYIYGDCPWVVSDVPLTPEQVAEHLTPPNDYD